MIARAEAIRHSPGVRTLLIALVVDAVGISALLVWNAVDRIRHHEWLKPTT